MRVEGRPIDGHNLQAALDELHADVYRLNMAPYWVVDRTVKHDEDRQVMDSRKAVPFIWKYKTTVANGNFKGSTLQATATDMPGNGCVMTARIGE